MSVSKRLTMKIISKSTEVDKNYLHLNVSLGNRRTPKVKTNEN